MDPNTIPKLILLCDTYAAFANVSHWRVSFLANGDGSFFRRLKAGKGCTISTAIRVSQWFSDHWPADLAWPRDVPRPTPRKSEAA